MEKALKPDVYSLPFQYSRMVQEAVHRLTSNKKSKKQRSLNKPLYTMCQVYEDISDLHYLMLKDAYPNIIFMILTMFCLSLFIK